VVLGDHEGTLYPALAAPPSVTANLSVIVARVRRGLLKDLANTPTQIVRGWRLYGPDLRRLANLAGEVVSIDLLTGDCNVGATRLDPPLGIAEELAGWLRKRFDSDAVPPGTVHRATVILKPRTQPDLLVVECTTVIESARGTYESHDTVRWAASDVDDW
jgi:hypothetical protein